MPAPDPFRRPSLPSVRSPGVLTLLGAAVLTAAVLVDVTTGLVPPARWPHSPARQHSVRSASLLVGWGLLFVANVVVARERYAHGWLWRVGNVWTVAGFGVVTAGFGVVVFASLLGVVVVGFPVDRATALHLGSAVVRVGLAAGVAPGSVLYGLAWAREAAVARSVTTPLSLAAGLLSLTAVGFVGSLVLGGVVPPLVERVLSLGLPFGWLAFGVARWASVRGTP